MNDKEYTYDIDKYTIGVDTNGEDGIGLTVAIIKNGEINFLGNCYGENARCIDLLIKENQELKEKVKKLSQWDNNKDSRNSRQRVANAKLIKENQELKKQLEEYKKKLMRITKMEIKQIDEATFVGIDYFQDKCIVLKAQQKEFIKWLENYINLFDEKDIYEEGSCDTIEEILQKYKSIIGGEDENNKQ